MHTTETKQEHSPERGEQPGPEAKVREAEGEAKQAGDQRLVPHRQAAVPEMATAFAEITAAVEEAVEKAILRTLEGRRFKPAMVSKWVDELNTGCIQNLVPLSGSNFKLIASSIVFDNTAGGGLECTSSMFWSPLSDDSVTVRWENDSIGCIVNVFGMAL